MFPPLPLTPEPHGTPDAVLDLNGLWAFHPSPPDGFFSAPAQGDGWTSLNVPGEWAMQGMTVAEGAGVGYVRSFECPSAWAGRRVLLRCDGIYSDAVLWVNGCEAGSHLGGFTAFELDVTDLVRPGLNWIAVRVTSASAADRLASGMKYATHDLGGITRGIRLVAVPRWHVAHLFAHARFEPDGPAVLTAQVRVSNTMQRAVTAGTIEIELSDGGGAALAPVALAAGASGEYTLAIRVPQPRRWDPEHPNLYDLRCTLREEGLEPATIRQRVGLRQVEVRGNRLFVNGTAVKLRGVNRHEAHPLAGRSPWPGLGRADAEAFRAMNCNFIRCSHYPPSDELLDACDALGLFVQVEAPFCWAVCNDAGEDLAYTIQAEAETVLRDRNHPCVLMWSLANESSPFGRNFDTALNDHLRALDPTRPFVFEVQTKDSLSDNPSCADLAALHYPGLNGTELVAKETRPVLFGEFAHLNVYNRSELFTDPGLRDVWGEGVAAMWEKMHASAGCLGGAVWAGVDDWFLLPSGPVGYGEWGPLDAWRRRRPEFWHLRKLFSPVRIAAREVAPSTGGMVEIGVENRHLFSDLDEIRFEWTCGGSRGRCEVSAPPGGAGTLVVSLPDAPGPTLDVAAVDARGVAVDEWRIRLAPEAARPRAAAARGVVTRGARGFSIGVGDWEVTIDAATGLLAGAVCRGTRLCLAGPEMMLLPLKREKDSKVGQWEVAAWNPLVAGWQTEGVSAAVARLDVRGSSNEAAGGFFYEVVASGVLRIGYDFTLRQELEPRQIGIVLTLPRACDRLRWKRRGQWSVYPDDHIGREEGETVAFPVPAPGLLRHAPPWPWFHDCTPGGCHDFRSTKHHILSAGLLDAQGAGIGLLSDGRQHVRAWIDGDRVRFLLADFSNEGAANFFNEHVLPRPVLPAGHRLQGSFDAALFCA